MAAAPVGIMQNLGGAAAAAAAAPTREHGRGACAGPCVGGEAAAGDPCGRDASAEPTQDEGAAAGARPAARRELCCQVPGCGADLSGASSYLKRYRVCITHQRAPMVALASGERRFCQQCGRFQPLGDFDANKRSCRERLSRHNARRRKGPGGEDTTASDEPSCTATATAATKPAAGAAGGGAGGALRRVKAGRVAKRAAAARSASVSGPSNSASLTASGSDATFQPSGSEASSAATSPPAPAPPAAAAKSRAQRRAAARPPPRAATRSPSGSPESKPRAGAVLRLRLAASAGPTAGADAPTPDAPHHPALAALAAAAPVGRAASLPGPGPFLASSPLPAMLAALGSGPLPQFAAEPARAAATAPAQGPAGAGAPLALPNPFAAWLPPAAPAAAAAASPRAPAPGSLGLEPAGFPALPSGAFGSVGLELSANADLAMALRALDEDDGGDAAAPLCAVPRATAASAAAAAAAAAAASCGPMVLDLSGAVPALMPVMQQPPGSTCTLSDAPSACAFAPFATMAGQPRPPSPNPASSLLAEQVLDSIVDSWAAAMEHDGGAPAMSDASPVPRSAAPGGAAAGWVPQQIPPPLPVASVGIQAPSAWPQQPQQLQPHGAAWSPAGWGQQMAPLQALALAQRPLQLDLRLGAPLHGDATAPGAACGLGGSHLQDMYALPAGAGLPALRTAIAACGMTPAGVAATGCMPQ